MRDESVADQIRTYLKVDYIDPARSSHQATVRIVAGDVHKALGLHNRVPAVCQVLGGRKFLAENNLILEKHEGPRSGQSTTAAFLYRLPDSGQSQPDQAKAAWERLRGIGKEVFAALGGGEKFLRSERDNFYSAGHDPLQKDKS